MHCGKPIGGLHAAQWEKFQSRSKITTNVMMKIYKYTWSFDLMPSAKLTAITLANITTLLSIS